MKYRLPFGIYVALFPGVAMGAPLPDADLDPAEQVIMLCDAGKDRLHIRSLGDHDDNDASYPQRILVRVENLIGISRGQYRTYKSRSYKCGRYNVRFSGDALNSNIQGELGAEPAFLSVGITRGATDVLPVKRLVICESGDASPRWGRCPQGYAIRIDVRHEVGQSVISVETYRMAPVLDAEIVKSATCDRVPDAAALARVTCGASR